jgi:hypothetical protein
LSPAEKYQALIDFADEVDGYVAGIELAIDRSQLASATRVAENLRSKAKEVLAKTGVENLASEV